MDTLKVRILAECDGRQVTPDEIVDDVIKNNPNSFSDEDLKIIKRFWELVNY
jgi:hypothetical protein